MGHYQNECKAAEKDSDIKTCANVVSKEPNDALICFLESKIEVWVLDTRESFHATSRGELFKNYVLCNFGKAYLGDDYVYDVINKGKVHIKLNGFI